jgi:hypothetical protein
VVVLAPMNPVWLILGAIATVYFLAAEAIDMAGRIEYVGKHWPNLLKWVRHRTSYRILLLISTLLVIADAYLYFHPDSASPRTVGSVSIVPRIGNGSDRYREIPNSVLANMLEDETEKIAKSAAICTLTESKYSPGNIQPAFTVEQMRKWFVRDFKAEDFPDVVSLYDEAIRRLGPGAKDSIGEDNIKLISMQGMDQSESVCNSVVELLPYLRKLSSALRHALAP